MENFHCWSWEGKSLPLPLGRGRARLRVSMSWLFLPQKTPKPEGECSSTENQTQKLNELKQKVMTHVWWWVCTEFPTRTSHIPSKSCKNPPPSPPFIKLMLERVFAKNYCLSSYEEQGWALPSSAAISASAWGILCTPCTGFSSCGYIPTSLHPLCSCDIMNASQKLNITKIKYQFYCSLNHPCDSGLCL